MKPSPKRTVKAWAIVDGSNHICFTETKDGKAIHAIVRKRKHLDSNQQLNFWGQRAIPIEITYSLPTPRKKK